MKLHGYWRSSASWRVRIALNYKNVAYEYVPVNLLAGGQRLAEGVALDRTTPEVHGTPWPAGQQASSQTGPLASTSIDRTRRLRTCRQLARPRPSLTTRTNSRTCRQANVIATTLGMVTTVAIRKPAMIEGAHIQVTASIGLTDLSGCTDDESALRQSDVALYAAKRAGRNGFAWFEA